MVVAGKANEGMAWGERGQPTLQAELLIRLGANDSRGWQAFSMQDLIVSSL